MEPRTCATWSVFTALLVNYTGALLKTLWSRGTAGRGWKRECLHPGEIQKTSGPLFCSEQLRVLSKWLFVPSAPPERSAVCFSPPPPPQCIVAQIYQRVDLGVNQSCQAGCRERARKV
jgi:hypothetical protein